MYYFAHSFIPSNIFEEFFHIYPDFHLHRQTEEPGIHGIAETDMTEVTEHACTI